MDRSAITLLLIDEKNKENLRSTYQEITARDTECFVISDTIFENNNKNKILQIEKVNHYEEIMFTVALQYLAYILSIKRNINPDKPRNLAKVVTVE